jgi:hypothetical protein
VTRTMSAISRRRAARAAAPVAASVALMGTLTGCATAAVTGTVAETPVNANYRDGRFQADGPYESPAGNESIIVVVQLENDIVTDVEIGLYPTSATSSTYQDLFAGGIGDLVIGQDLDEIDVTVVAGSSLTSFGFRAALSAIKEDALES